MAAGEVQEARRQTQRGTSHPQGQCRRHRFSRNVRRAKQQRRRRQASNRQIWEELRATTLQSADAETATAQPPTAMGVTGVHQAGGQHSTETPPPQPWIAVGDQSTDCASRVRRQVTDGVLLKLTVSIAGRQLIALVDSGASRCYMSPETVTAVGLQTSPALVHLELADGSKIRSTQQVQGVKCTMGNFVCSVDFTVTKLLHQVDMVLGVNWLARWNPVIDWQTQRINIWTGMCWERLQGRILDEVHAVGTVKVFDYRCVEIDPGLDFEILKQPKFWQYTDTANAWTHSSEGDANARVHMENFSHSSHSLDPAQQAGNSVSNSLRAPERIIQTQRQARTVQRKITSREAGQRQIISAKQMQRLAAKGEHCYLALIFPHQG